MDLYRLGVPVKVVGATGLRSHDSRRWQNQPHLSVSLAYLRDVFEYLHSRQIRFYRLSGQLAPYLTHPDLPQFHGQIEECATELAAIGDLARHYGIRPTMHPAFYVQLGSPDLTHVQRSIEELEAATRLMDGMGLEVESVLVIHVGGTQGDKEASTARFIQQVEQLPRNVRRRLALENDDRFMSAADVLRIHRHTGLRVVLDVLHHRCINPSGLSTQQALAAALDSWPGDQQPKIHFSSPRTAVRQLVRNRQRTLVAPLANQHSDFINPFEFIDLLRAARADGLRPFDIMLEAKGKDLALLRLREQIAQFAPDLAGVIG
ncbi:MAG: UV DNA damage repair endonuclease UvsE [Caldilineaceae bacterium]